MTRRASGSFRNGKSWPISSSPARKNLRIVVCWILRGAISRANRVSAALPWNRKPFHHASKVSKTEDKSEVEGTVYYDIRFHAVAPVDGKMIQLIINLEAQNDFNPGYPLLKRAVYYCSRMISSQYGTVFVKSHYEKIQKVYSIWICTMPTKKWEYNISRYRLMEDHLIGHTQAERNHYDLITIVLVCLGSKNHKQLKGILRLLNMLLLDNMGSQEKQELLAKEFDVTMTPHLEKGVAEMCNLSEGIERRGEKRGQAIGEKRGWNLGKQDDVLEMLKDGVPLEKIAQYTKLSLEAIADIAKQNKLI